LQKEQLDLIRTLEKMKFEKKYALENVDLKLQLSLHQNRALFKTELLAIANAKDKCKDKQLQPMYDLILSKFKSTMEENLSEDDHVLLMTGLLYRSLVDDQNSAFNPFI